MHMQLRPEFIAVSSALGIVAVLSAVTAQTLSTIFNLDWWNVFILAFTWQFVTGYLWNLVIMTKLETARLLAVKRLTSTIECAYCKEANLIAIHNECANSFTCTKCNKVSGVKIRLIATQLN